jgi:hypothetical protein
VIPLPGYGPDYFVYLFGVFVVVISLKTGDLASKFGFNNGYCYLPLVCDVQSWDTSTRTRFFQAATQSTLCPDFAVLFP